MRSHEVLLGSALALMLATAGCSFRMDNQSSGEQGNLQFAYSSCLLGCSMDRTALQGSMVAVTINGGDPDVALQARLADAPIGVISSQLQSCSCRSSSGGSERRDVKVGNKCGSSEDKVCSVSVEIETKQAGDAKLEIVDGKGKLVDAVTVHVRPAARIEVDVQDRKAGPDGVYSVATGERLKVASRVLDDAADPMIFAKHGVTQIYGDRNIVGPDVDDIFGSTEVEGARAVAVGETALTIRAVGASSVVRFRVTPR